MSTENTDDSDDNDVAASTVVGSPSAPMSLSQHMSEWVKTVTPPDLWRHGRPSLKTSWVWARHGQHLPNDDTARLGSQVGAYITFPLRAALLYLDWLLERPSRAVFALLLLTALAMTIWS